MFKKENKPNHPAVGVAYVLLGLLVILAISYLAFAWVGKTFPEIAWLTTLLSNGCLIVLKDRYDRHESKKRLAVTEEEDQPRRLVVMLVEDNPTLVSMIRMAFFNQRLQADLFVATSIEAALDMLAQQPPYEFYPKPDIILLDLVFSSTPLQGVDFLEKKTKDPAIFDIPTIIMTAHEKEEFKDKMHLLETCCKWVRKGAILTLITAIDECTNENLSTDGMLIRRTGSHLQIEKKPEATK